MSKSLSLLGLVVILATCAVLPAQGHNDDHRSMIGVQMLMSQFDTLAVADSIHRSRGVPPRMTDAMNDGLSRFAISTRRTLNEAAVAHRRLFAHLQAGSNNNNTGTGSGCDQTAYNTALVNFGQRCANYKVDSLFDFSTYSNASLALVEQTCADNCTLLVAGLLKDHGACMTKELKMQARIVKTLCIRDNVTQDRCASTLKLFKFLSCDQQTTRAACEAENFQCQWAPTQKCEPRATDAFLSRFCRPCLANFLKWALRMDKSLKFLEALVQQVWCRRIDGEYCMPRLAYFWADNTTLAFVSNISTTDDFLNRSCVGTGGKCFRAVASVFVRVSFELAKDTLRTCADNATTVAGRRACMSAFNAYLENLQKTRKLFKKMCTKNAGNRYCISEHIRLVNSPCYLDFANRQVCNTTCSYTIGDTLLSMGCCSETVHDWVYGPLPYLDPSLLPRGAKAVAPERPAPVVYNRTNLTSIRSHIYQYFRFCPTIAETNASVIGGLWDICPKQNNFTSDSLKVTLRLPWRLLKDDDDLRSKIAEALAADIGRAVAAVDDDMEGGTLSEDSSSTITVATTNAHGFTVLQSSSAVTYTTKSSAATSSDAQDQTSTFNSQKTTNSLVLPTTAGVVSGECSSCIGNDDASLTDGSNDDASIAGLGGSTGASTTTSVAPSTTKKGLFSAAATQSTRVLSATVAAICIAFAFLA